MAGLSPGWFAAAVMLLLAAHAVRAVRWAFLFPKTKAGADRTGLLVGLSIGYAVNAVIPFRIGEVCRALVAKKLRGGRLAEILATIVVERVADLLVLALIFAGTWRWAADPSQSLRTAGIFAVTGLTVASAVIGVRWSRRLRAVLWRIAGLFNQRVRLGLADLSWSAGEIVAGLGVAGWRFTLSTIAMWGLYGAAYAVFAAASTVPSWAVADTMLQHPLTPLGLSSSTAADGSSSVTLYLFTVAPLVLILALYRLSSYAPVTRIVRPLLDLGKSGRASHVARSDRFRIEHGYTDFIDALFSDTRRAVSGFGLRAVDDCVVHGFLHGGSDALTALVETQNGLLIRKFALGSAAPKLHVQADWLRRHAGDHLPLAPVIGEQRSSGAFQYDMPLVPGAVGFCDAIHIEPDRINASRLTHVLDRVDALHGATALGAAPDALVERYIDDKIVGNAGAITAFAQKHLGARDYSLNGTAFDLDEWQLLNDRHWLSAQMRRREAATIHGDLTIENIIVAPDHPHGLYIIDPNPDNLFNSPLIDWAKMMQSLHLGYEALSLSAACAVDERALRLPLARSEAYARLHEALENEITARFDEDAVREVYFHELVNYLRLTPYKIRQSVERGLAFFACSSLLLRNYREHYA